MPRRDRLVNDLLTIDSAYHYLSRVGNSSITFLGAPPRRLHEYFAALDAAHDLDSLLDIFFLLSETSLRFHFRELDGLIRGLARSIAVRPAVVGPGVPGRILWGETERNQRIGRIGPNQFVANVPRKDFGVAPNRILRGVLEDSLSAAKRFLNAFGKGPLRDQVSAIRARCEWALKNPYLRDVPPLDGADYASVQVTRKMRISGYRSAADLAASRAAAKGHKEAARWGILANCVETRFLEPINDDWKRRGRFEPQAAVGN
jgi:hypothetical protein